MRIGCAVSLLGSSLLFLPDSAQAQGTRRVSFQVENRDGTPRARILIEVRDSADGRTLENRTDNAGIAQFDLAAGRYYYEALDEGRSLARGSFTVPALQVAQQVELILNVPIPDLTPSNRFNLNDINYFSSGGAGGRESATGESYSAQVKFRVSVRYRIIDLTSIKDSISGIYATFSQQSLWNIRDSSAPFFDNNYRPGAFLYLRAFAQPKNLRPYFGVVHESNGRSGPQSRGWNRAYAGMTFGRVNSDVFSGGVALWLPWGVEEQHADIVDFAGRGEAEFYWQPHARDGDPGLLTVHTRTRVWGKQILSNAELNVLLHLNAVQCLSKLSAALHFQVFHGSAETLLTYRDRRTVARVGLAVLR